MKRKLILKFDVKDNHLRCDMYQAESIRVQGRATSSFKEIRNSGTVHHIVNNLLSQFDEQFSIDFKDKDNYLKHIKAWVKDKIFKIYIRENVPSDLKAGILKLFNDKILIVND